MYGVRYLDIYTTKPTNIAELKTALLSIWKICHRSSLIRQSYNFERYFDRVFLQLAHTLNTQFKDPDGSWHSLLKRLKCWRKSYAKFVNTDWMLRTRLHVHLKKCTLKFKLLYQLNHICYFNKICGICVLNAKFGEFSFTIPDIHCVSKKRTNFETV